MTVKFIHVIIQMIIEMLKAMHIITEAVHVFFTGTILWFSKHILFHEYSILPLGTKI